MTFLKLAIVAIVLLVNLLIASPSWAGQDHRKGADYAEVTQAINQLLQVQNSLEQAGYTPKQYQQQLTKLQAQKAVMESTTTRAQCHNQTVGNLAVYVNKPKKLPTQLYYLAAGQETDDDWDCDGYYLPAGTQVVLSPNTEAQALTEPLAIKFVDGTQSFVSMNPAGVLELNVAPAKIFKAGETAWIVPILSQTEINAQVPSPQIID
jgi:Tfp pilus assembly protein PilE